MKKKPQELISAIWSDDLNAVKRALESGEDPNNYRRKDNLYPLILAIKLNNVEIVRTLIEYGADLNVCLSGGSAIHYAMYKQSSEIIKILIEANADLNLRDRFGATPIHMAIGRGDIDIVKMIIARGADVNARDNNEWTPLMYGVFNKRPEIMAALIEAGADVSLKEDNGQTALDIMKSKDPDGYSKFLALIRKNSLKVEDLQDLSCTSPILDFDF